MMSCQDNLETTIATYDATAQAYAARWASLRLEGQLRRFSSFLSRGARVLDVGCGPGRDVGFLRELGYRAIGLDRSWGMVTEARRRLAAPWACGDLRALPFADRSFAGVWACASLLHLPRAEMPRALAELRRVLDAGVLYLAVKEGDGERWVTEGSQHRRYFVYYRLPEVRDLCQQAGFEILETWTNADNAARVEMWLNVIARATCRSEAFQAVYSTAVGTLP